MTGEWIKINRNETGFYRVNYDPTLWGLLADQLKTDYKVKHFDRYNIHLYPIFHIFLTNYQPNDYCYLFQHFFKLN